MTRLNQLLELRQRIDQAIAQERATHQHQPHTPPPPPRHANQAERLMHELHITAIDVKRWAHTTGLITNIQRGRIALELVQAYAHAHPTAPTPDDPDDGRP